MGTKRKLAAVFAIGLGVAALTATFAWAKTVTGTPRADTLRGTPSADKIYGKAGNDKLYGLGGNDLLVGGPGADRVFCGAGRDTVQADARDRVARDCEVVRRPGGNLPPDPRPPTSVVDFRVCPEAEATPGGGSFFCSVDRAGETIRASRLFCTVRIANGTGKQAQIAFVRGGSEVFQTDPFPMTRDNLYTLYATIDAPQAGSWACRAKVNGATLREISFSVG